MNPVAPRTTLTGQHTTVVVEVEPVSETACVLRLERRGLVFTPGQCVILGLPGHREQREYSIYSATAAPTLDVLIRVVERGMVSRQLHDCKPGDAVQIEGPVGFFTIEDCDLLRERFLFVASGTGIAPFHAMVASYADLDYQMLHGVRESREAFGATTFAPDRHVVCTSRESGPGFAGRVTDYLRAHPAPGDALCLLCGNVRMIDEVHDLLRGQGVPGDRIRAEVYF